MRALLVASVLFACARDSAAATPAASSALVEVFTSEGCSSCPPADQVFNALPARSGSRDLVMIAWHVDYWDELGWPDPYASRSFTARQRSYSRSVYTPELLINGVEYTGSRSSLETSARDAALDPASVPISLSIEGLRTGPSVRVRFDAHTAPAGSRVVLVLTESGLVQHVTAGENSGKTLRHDHVARAMKVAPTLSGVVDLDVPSGVVRANAAAVGFVERPSDMRTLGAATTSL